MAYRFEKASGTILKRFQQKAEEMKKNVLASADPSPDTFSGRCYYFSNDGADSNDGLSPQSALKTPGMVEHLPLQRGDAVLFRRGDIFRGAINCKHDGITFSAWGEGEKPVICGSARNYAEPELWEKSEVPGIWVCTLPINNAGVITFDHDPRITGKYDVLLGFSVPLEPEMEPSPLHLKNDLDFFSDLDTNTLYLKSEKNPGLRFKQIEIGENIHLFCFRGGIREDLTVDNLHITLTGAHAVSFITHKRGEVRNCIIDYVGGSVLWRKGGSIMSDKMNIRYGNAIEVYGGCSGFKVWNNWIYQIYDTGITHQFHRDKNTECIQENVEYFDNLIEYCFWSIEYYNTDTKYSITRNIYVHNNFCRFGGAGWGCTPERREKSPMYSFMKKADETENYLTEKNIFQFTHGVIYKHFPPVPPENSLIFRENIYIQYADAKFALWDDISVPFNREEVTEFLSSTLKEEDCSIYEAEKTV
jgi:hypothetical protein